MGWGLSWLRPAPVNPQAQFCSNEFPQLWRDFVDNFVESGFCGAAVATPEEAGMPSPSDTDHPAPSPPAARSSPHASPPSLAAGPALAEASAAAAGRGSSDAASTSQASGSGSGGSVLPTYLPAVPRLIAIGDLHGDYGKAVRAFRLAGLVDAHGRWAGGAAVCVQVGDVLDRGDAEIRILHFLERLQAEARAAGGALYVLNGNHETMNVMGNHRYATQGAGREIARWQRWQELREALYAACPTCSSSSTGAAADGGSGKQSGWGWGWGVLRPFSTTASSNTGSTAGQGGTAALPARPPASLSSMALSGAYGAQHFARTYALQPGAHITTRFFAAHPTVLQVGSTLFVHGGVLPHHVEYGLDRINRETREWMLGRAPPPAPAPPPAKASSPAPPPPSTSSPPPAPSFLRGASALVWARDYSAEDEGRCDCAKLEGVLKSIPGAARMVVGHTIQDGGINAACGGRVLRVDVGMSAGCGGGDVEVLEVLGDGQQVRRLREGLPAEDITHSRGSGRTVLTSHEHAPPPAGVTSWLAAIEQALATAVRSQ